MAPQVFDGFSLKYVTAANAAAGAGGVSPVPPVSGGNGTIFVSVVSYRDGERCGETIRSIFENAKDPNRIIVGLVEQNEPDDKFCLEEYCKSYGLTSLARRTVREGVVKIMTRGGERAKCPHYDQVRYLAFYHVNAKGPILARSMNRKILANEEFCMQVDAHTDFAKNWDEMVLEEWQNAGNEFGIITSVPPEKADKEAFSVGGKAATKVPRQCAIKFRENKFPDYESPADGYALDLDKPLLSNAWSAAFSFAKCHLEESAPYDPFLAFAMPIEQFSRYARFWTRGYDTYTPTRNIVFHDYGPQLNGHGNNEWFKRQRDRFRKGSIERVKTALQIQGGDPSDKAQANLGIYGLGKRRSLQQLQEFTNLDFINMRGNAGDFLQCTGFNWVPYDPNISPVENLFDNPDNLDPQPEFPLRTKLTYYQQVEYEPAGLDLPLDSSGSVKAHVDGFGPDQQARALGEKPTLPPLSLLFVFWIFGLVAWCVFFMNSPVQLDGSRKKRSNGYKDV